MKDVVEKLLKKYQYLFVGLKLSRHFFERLCERFRGNISYLKSVLHYCNEHLCELIYECCTSHNSRYEVVLSDIKFVVVCTLHKEYPVLTVTTCYTKVSKKFNKKYRW